jgi:hypothetical protein
VLLVAGGGRLSPPPALVLALSPLGLRCFVSSLSFSQWIDFSQPLKLWSFCSPSLVRLWRFIFVFFLSPSFISGRKAQI